MIESYNSGSYITITLKNPIKYQKKKSFFVVRYCHLFFVEIITKANEFTNLCELFYWKNFQSEEFNTLLT